MKNYRNYIAKRIASIILSSAVIVSTLGIPVAYADTTGVDLSGLFNKQLERSAETAMIVDIQTHSQKDVVKLSNMGLDIAEVKKGAVTVLITAQRLKEVEAEGFQCTITEPNYLNYLKTKVDRQGTLNKYHTFDQVESELKAMEQQHSDIAKLSIIGYSNEHRPIYGLKISGDDSKKPSSLFMGLHHSREWISVEVPMALAKELTSKYNTDKKIKALVDSCNIWIVPVVNPDGFVYSQTEYTMWRKNRRDNNDGTHGVDPNRNYGYEWGGPNSTSYTGAETYRGPNPFSEPCTQAIRDLAKKEKFRTSISFHSYSELVLYPYGYETGAQTPDDSLLSGLAKELAQFNGYEPQNAAGLYPANGDSDDYLYGSAGVLPFTIELGDEFIPSDSEVDTICRNNVDASLYLIEKSKTIHASNHPDFINPVDPADPAIPNETNLAVGKTAKASSIVGSYAADQAFDSDKKTCWATYGSTDSWIRVDLSKASKVSKLVLKWSEKNYPQKYDVQQWNGNDWVTLQTVDSDGGLDEIVLDSAIEHITQLRIVAKKISSEFLALYEMEVFDSNNTSFSEQ